MAKNLEISFLLDFYGEMLTEKQREVMEQYFNDDLSLAEIADNFGISRQGVRDAIKRGEATVLELEEKVGFAKRSKALGGQLDELELIAQNIRFSATGRVIDVTSLERDTKKIVKAISEMRKA